MLQVKIDFVERVAAEIEAKMSADLVAYESHHHIDVNYKPFALILTDKSNEAIGVLNAYTAFSEIYVNDMWVDHSHRGKGYGRKLLQALEERFEDQGFNNMNLVTSAFQAPEFYRKCGFTAEFVRINNKNPQLTKTFFVKYFKNEAQTQGILK